MCLITMGLQTPLGMCCITNELRQWSFTPVQNYNKQVGMLLTHEDDW